MQGAPLTFGASLQLPSPKGKEYFDVFYGIEPLAWAFCGFCSSAEQPWVHSARVGLQLLVTVSMIPAKALRQL